MKYVLGKMYPWLQSERWVWFFTMSKWSKYWINFLSVFRLNTWELSKNRYGSNMDPVHCMFLINCKTKLMGKNFLQQELQCIDLLSPAVVSCHGLVYFVLKVDFASLKSCLFSAMGWGATTAFQLGSLTVHTDALYFHCQYIIVQCGSTHTECGAIDKLFGIY